MTFVNATDYLPMTEALGVRITVHSKDETPMPDSFGYNAPTGFISSFGLHMASVEMANGETHRAFCRRKSSDYRIRTVRARTMPRRLPRTSIMTPCTLWKDATGKLKARRGSKESLSEVAFKRLQWRSAAAVIHATRYSMALLIAAA